MRSSRSSWRKSDTRASAATVKVPIRILAALCRLWPLRAHDGCNASEPGDGPLRRALEIRLERHQEARRLRHRALLETTTARGASTPAGSGHRLAGVPRIAAGSAPPE